MKIRSEERCEVHFFENLINGMERMKGKVNGCSLRENHNLGGGHEGQVDFEKLRVSENGFGYGDMKGINKGLEKRYYVCLECGFLYRA